ncbi:MAG: hypothetical protein JWO77_801 [Ilumatobacteraceae bacterium]|nr:hypothetical protein [Ilumatobacteraceae bacterium]
MTSTPDPPGTVRTLIPLTINFSVRYVVLTGLLKAIEAHCRPVLGLSWDDPALEADLRATGAEVIRLPEPVFDHAAGVTRTLLDMDFHRRLASPSRPIEMRRRALLRPQPARLRRHISDARLLAGLRRPGASEQLVADYEAWLDTSPSLAEHRDLLREHRIDAVVSITPYAVQEALLLPAAVRLGIPVMTSVLSFDNLTTRPPLPVRFEKYLVWNAFNAEEIERAYEGLDPASISIVGPAQFDFYQDPRYVEDRATWARRLGVPEGVPTILFGAGPPVIAPQEPQYVRQLLAAIADGRLPAGTTIVLRRHPHDLPERWDEFRGDPRVTWDDPGPVGTTVRPGQASMGEGQIVGLCSTLAHTDVHVNVSSTMTLDGAFFGKPQIGPDYDVEGGRGLRRQARELYEREHFLPIVASGGLEIPHSPEELVAQVRSALDDPERLAPQRRAMLTAICTHLDGRCTERVAQHVNAFLDDVAGRATA